MYLLCTPFNLTPVLACYYSHTLLTHDANPDYRPADAIPSLPLNQVCNARQGNRAHQSLLRWIFCFLLMMLLLLVNVFVSAAAAATSAIFIFIYLLWGESRLCRQELGFWKCYA